MAANLQQIGASQSAAFAERHYSVQEVAAMWNLSTDRVIDLFDKEPGVLVISNEVLGRRKRRYRTLRIPESVLQRVHRRLAKA